MDLNDYKSYKYPIFYNRPPPLKRMPYVPPLMNVNHVSDSFLLPSPLLLENPYVNSLKAINKSSNYKPITYNKSLMDTTTKAKVTPMYSKSTNDYYSLYNSPIETLFNKQPNRNKVLPIIKSKAISNSNPEFLDDDMSQKFSLPPLYNTNDELISSNRNLKTENDEINDYEEVKSIATVESETTYANENRDVRSPKSQRQLNNPHSIHEYLYSLAKKDKNVGYSEQYKDVKRFKAFNFKDYNQSYKDYKRFKESQGFGADFLDPTKTKEHDDRKWEKHTKRNEYGQWAKERNLRMYNKNYYNTEGFDKTSFTLDELEHSKKKANKKMGFIKGKHSRNSN